MNRNANRRNSAALAPPYEFLDVRIREVVRILFENGIETFESCDGGAGHAFFEPTVRFFGQRSAGFKALSVAMDHGLRVSELRRYYSLQDGEPVGPYWEMTFILG